MNTTLPEALGFFTGWLGQGPWRSKSVLAALAVVLVGMGFWFSAVKSGPPQHPTSTAPTNAPAMAPSDTAGAPAETDWNWRRPLPWYVKIGASYVLGYSIGWFFRKLLQLALIIVALAIALLAFGKYVGCDTTRARQEVKRSGEWAERQATAGEDYLKRLLPSATGGAIGTFLGFRRRGKDAIPKPAA